MTQRSHSAFPKDRHIPIRNLYTHLDLYTQSCQKSEASTCYSSILNRTHSSRKMLEFSKHSDSRSTKHCNISEKQLTIFISNLHKDRKKINNYIQPIQQVMRLDANCLQPNFYHHTIDYSMKGILGVILSDKLFVYADPYSLPIERIRSSLNSSIKFNPKGNGLYVGDNYGNLQIYDMEKYSFCRRIRVNYTRIGVIENIDNNVFLTGCKGKDICKIDLRQPQPKVQTYQRHQDEVCGLSMNFQSNGCYFASGGGDSQIFIWDLRKNIPITRIKQHKGAVKALKWSPLRYNLLYSSGGHLDKQILIWNQSENIIEKKIKVNNTVTSIQFSKKRHLMITSHIVHERQPTLNVWDLKDYEIIRHNKQGKHNKRGSIINMVSNPLNQDEIISAQANEIIKYWNITPKRESSSNSYDFKQIFSNQARKSTALKQNLR